MEEDTAIYETVKHIIPDVQEILEDHGLTADAKGDFETALAWRIWQEGHTMYAEGWNSRNELDLPTRDIPEPPQARSAEADDVRKPINY